MIKHIVLMTFKKEMTDSDRRIVSVKLKSGLENLSGKVDGLLEISVESILLDSCSADFLLCCKLKDERALENLKSTPLMFNIKPILDSGLEWIHTASYHV